MRRAGVVLLSLVAVVAIVAPWLAPNRPDQRFDQLLYAPPTSVHLFQSGVQAPFIHPWRLVSRLERRFEEDQSTTVTLRWFRADALVSADPDGGAPLLLLGADSYGRDIFSRLLHGSRTSLLLAVVSVAGATMLGGVIGLLTGFMGGRFDLLVSRVSELFLVMPAIYMALALRAVMPLVLPASAIFALLAGIFVILGWPIVARGVRAIVQSERERDYVAAARATGASSSRIVMRHLLPATQGYLSTQATLLLPAFILAEATLSYVGLGFPDETPTWGTMLQEAANVALLGDAPWTLAPALAIFLVVLAVNLAVPTSVRGPVQLDR